MQKINLVEIKSDDDFEIDMMYAKTQNMMQTDVYSAVGMGNRREMLRQMMENVGLLALEHEWWHFNLPNKEKYPLVNSVFAADGSCQFFI